MVAVEIFRTGESLAIEASGSAAEPEGASSEAFLATMLRLSYKDARDRVLRQFEREYLQHLLERTKGNVSRAAREAQMDRSHLTDLLARHRIR